MTLRIWKSIGRSFWKTFTISCTVITVLTGFISIDEPKTFFQYCAEKPIASLISIVIIVLLWAILFCYYEQNVYPNRQLCDFVFVDKEKSLYIFKADKNIERDSVVEIRRKRWKNVSEEYALAFVDGYDEGKKHMVIQHIACYNKNNNTYDKSKQPESINKKEYKKIFYRPYITIQTYHSMRGDKSGETKR